MKRTRITAATAGLAAAGLLLAACGGSGPSTGGLTGQPIKLGMVATVNSTTGLSYPNVQPAAEAAISSINDAGGINGRPLQLVFCDDQDDPQVAAACANRLVDQESVLAVVGGLSRQDAAMYAQLEAKKVAWICDPATVGGDFTSRQSYPCTAGNDVFRSFGALMDPSWKTLAFLHSASPVGQQLWTIMQDVAAERGMSAKEVLLDLKATNLQPSIQGIVDSGADVWSLAGTSAQPPALLSTEKSVNVTTPLVLPSSLVSTQLLSQQQATGIVVRTGLQVDTDPATPQRRQFDADLAKYGSTIKDKSSDSVAASWLGVELFALYARQAGDAPSSAGFQQWLDGQSALETGLTAPLDFTTPGPIAEHPRVVNVYVKPAELKDGQVVVTSGTWVSSIPGAKPVTR